MVGGTPRNRAARQRFPLLALGAASLLGGLNAALLNASLPAPIASQASDVHGAVMVFGFLGCLISLERAQALAEPGRSWPYLAPLTLGLGGMITAFGSTSPTALATGRLLFLEGALFLVGVYSALYRRAPLALLAAQILSALALLCAAALAFVFPTSGIIAFLATFVFITIGAERAELAQLTMGARAPATLMVLGVAMLVASFASVFFPPASHRAFGLLLIVCALWLLWRDTPRKLYRQAGLPRFISVSLGLGYLWLIVAGIAWIAVGDNAASVGYDVMVHGVFLGFTMSMIFAHAPVIFPAVLAISLPYHIGMWVPLIALHLTLALRVASGLLAGHAGIWQIAALLGVITILLFLVISVLTAVISGRASRRKREER